MPLGIGGVLKGLVGPVLDKVLPDKKAREAAELEMFKQEQAGQFKKAEVQMSAILAEANSKDPWTSRARPTFMYVIYIMILAAIPMGVLSAFDPEMAVAIAEGMKAWLAAIPDALWATFTAGYLGYTGFRSMDKRNDAKKAAAQAQAGII